jgi:hypothetical protein
VNPHELKKLQVQLQNAVSNESNSLKKFNEVRREYETAKQERLDLEKKIQSASIEPKISEHALLRYIERVYGIDLEAIQEKILTEQNKKAIRLIVNGKLPLGAEHSNHKAIIQNMTIVSIVEK